MVKISKKKFPITNEQKNAIKNLEKIRLPASAKADIVLVILGIKPATDVDVHKTDSNPARIIKVLQVCDLVVEQADISYMDEKAKRYLKIVAVLAVSQKKRLVNKLAKILKFQNFSLKQKSQVKYHTEFGRLMGFPETAIKAFVARKIINQSELPKNKNTILSFALSRRYWKKEWEVVKLWNNLIKKYAPKIYQDLLKEK